MLWVTYWIEWCPHRLNSERCTAGAPDLLQLLRAAPQSVHPHAQLAVLGLQLRDGLLLLRGVELHLLQAAAHTAELLLHRGHVLLLLMGKPQVSSGGSWTDFISLGLLEPVFCFYKKGHLIVTSVVNQSIKDYNSHSASSKVTVMGNLLERRRWGTVFNCTITL